MSTSRKQASADYIAINKSIQKCSTAKDTETFVSKNNDWNDVNVATAVRSLARNRSNNPAAYYKLFNLALPYTFRSRELSNIYHSIAKLFNELPSQFVRKLKDAKLIGPLLRCA